MTFPDDLGSQPGDAFDLAQTNPPARQYGMPGTPHEVDPYACPSCGGPTVSQPYGGGDRYCKTCDNLFTPEHLRAETHARAVQVAVARFNSLALEFGPTKAAVMLLTGLSSDEIDAVGGLS